MVAHKEEEKKPITRIYQIKACEENRDIIFEPLEQIYKRREGVIPAERYECVFEGIVESEDLEDIFTIFNISRPAGYTGRSMTTSDIVELQYSDMQSSFFFCDSVGFRPICFDKTKVGGISGGCK